MKRLISFALLVFVLTVTMPSISKAVTPKQYTLDQVTAAVKTMEKDLAKALETYNKYKDAGKLYEPSRNRLEACDLIQKIEEAVNEPEYSYRNAIKGGWTKDNVEMKNCLDKVYAFYTGKTKLPDAHFFAYIDQILSRFNI